MSRNSIRRHLSMPGMLRVVRYSFERLPGPLDTRGIAHPDCLMSGLAEFSLKMPSLPRFDRQVRRGEDPVQARNLYLWNGLQEPARTFAFPDRETFCRAIAEKPGKEDDAGLVRTGP